jgi:septal ring factor EnvC (AmiA/AmiB activator)
VVREKGEIYTVRYDAVNAMLLNEFLKEHCEVQEQEASIRQLKTTAAKQEATIAQQRKDSQAKTDKLEATIAQQQKEMQAVIARLNEQAAQIQKVSAQLATASPSRGGLEVTRTAPQTVSNK